MNDVVQKKILFVDDEERILAGFKRSFYKKGDEWDVEFANSGIDALNALEKKKFDVIVSDMRMPNMDGAELLQKVQKLYPDIIRIVLSGQTELEVVIRTVHVAHQFLTKPCDAKYLAEVIERAYNLQNILKNKFITSLVDKIGQLPSLPNSYQDLSSILRKPNATVKEISDTIEKDTVVTTQILQLINNDIFAISQQVTSISQAIQVIGITTLKSLTLSVGTFDSFKRKADGFYVYIDNLQKHSLLCAIIARNLLKDKNQMEDAFLSGILHDIGKLILLIYLPGEYQKVLKEAENNPTELYKIEREILGVTHAEVGAYLLGLWGLPYSVVEAVAYHHEPTKVEQKEFGVLGAVYIANCLTQDEPIMQEVNIQYLTELNVINQLSKWQDFVKSKMQIANNGQTNERYK